MCISTTNKNTHTPALYSGNAHTYSILLSSIGERTLLGRFARSKATLLGSIDCLVKEYRSIDCIHDGRCTAVCSRFAFDLETKTTEHRPASHLTRPGNIEGGLEDFKLTHDICHGTQRGIYAAFAACRGPGRRSSHGTGRDTYHGTGRGTYHGPYCGT